MKISKTLGVVLATSVATAFLSGCMKTTGNAHKSDRASASMKGCRTHHSCKSAKTRAACKGHSACKS